MFVNIDKVMSVEIQANGSIDKINLMLKADWIIIDTNRHSNCLSFILGHKRQRY